jgi:hypothetical protein
MIQTSCTARALERPAEDPLAALGHCLLPVFVVGGPVEVPLADELPEEHQRLGVRRMRALRHEGVR